MAPPPPRSTSSAAGQLKEQGNEEYRLGNYLKAAAIYTKAIKEEPANAVLYSNRAAALLKLNKLPKAWADAEQAMQLEPNWEKGYLRAAAVAEAQHRPEQALALYRSAQRVRPSCKEVAVKVRSLSKALANAGGGDGHSPPCRKPAAAAAQQADHSDSSGCRGDQSKAGPGAAASAAAAAPPPPAAAAAAAAAPAATGGGGSRAQAAPPLWRGGELPESAEQFQQQLLEYAMTKVLTSGTDFPPELHVLSADGNETAVRAPAAFANPAAFLEFVEMARQKAEELQAQAAVLMAPQAAIAFPQVWQKAGWPYQHEGGVLVQLQALSQQQLDALPQRCDAGIPRKYLKPSSADAPSGGGSSGSSSSSSGANTPGHSPRQQQDQGGSSGSPGGGSRAAAKEGKSAAVKDTGVCDRLWFFTDKGRDAWCVKEASCDFGLLPTVLRA